ncbi:MAG: DUF342 domain-containing protein [Clostridia bacterium]
MKVKAYSEMDARLLVKQAYGYSDDKFKLTIIKKPTNIFWGLIKRKGEYKVTIKKPQKKVSVKKQPQDWKNGHVEVRDGILKVVNPKDDGRYASIIANDPNIDVFVNDKKIKDTIILTEKDIVEFRPKIIEPVTEIIVGFSEDRMQAILKVYKEKGKEFYVKDSKRDISIQIYSNFKEIQPRNVTLEECIQVLNDANVKLEFIDIEAINKLVKSRMGGSIIVARGEKPIDGVKTQIRYYFDETEEDDAVIAYIGDVLAVKIMPALPGRDGATVTGEVVKARETEDELLRVGKGAILLDNSVKVVASISGRPVIKNGMISVIPLLVIASDVDKNTGNIEFDGDVIIKGNIMDNMRVAAKGKIKVFGSIFNAKIISNEDINIVGKVIGGKVVAGMNMTNYFCIAPLIEDIVEIINGIIEQIEAHKESGLKIVLSTIYSKRDTIKKCIEEIEKVSSLLEDDDAGTISDLLKKTKDSLIGINALQIRDQRQVRDLNEELIEHMRLIRNLYIHNANVTIQYAQNATIQSCGHIIVTGEGSYQSNLIAKDVILYKRSASSVKGGMLIAGKNIKAGTIGSHNGIHTYCRVLSKNGKVNAHCYNGTIINIDGNIQMLKSDYNNRNSVSR